LPVGTYDVGVTAFGDSSASASGLVVSEGATTEQDFTLQALPTVVVNGTVTDGSGQGWPLYAKVVVSGPPGFAGATLFTDPVTGYYSIALPTGVTYEFAVSAVGPGYVEGGGPLSLAVLGVSAPSAIVANWKLSAAPTCNAPGFGPGTFTGPAALSESFDAGTLPSGWSIDTLSSASWFINTGMDACGQFEGNRTGGSGSLALLDSGCYGDGSLDDSSLVTPSFDLTGRPTAAIRFASDFVDMDSGSVGSVDVSADNGAPWTNV